MPPKATKKKSPVAKKPATKKKATPATKKKAAPASKKKTAPASKKKAAPTTKKSAAPASKKKTAARAKPAALSQEARRSLLKPREGAAALGEALAVTWSNERGLRVDDLSAPKLASLVRKARRAEARQTALAEKQARQMQPIRDARLSADDALWRALLDLRAAVGLRARKDPTIEERFAALIDALRNEATAPAVPPVTPS